ncbi:MAG: clostripain-related cysteine peptidase, partial [Candidatus Mucispirillum faecigallinarum]|nr:clostripain-related cysteine peptidase [Candidatus Mucispirillum faecigallinarum]
MISCLMGNAVFMHTVKDYADYYIGSESNQATEAWDLSSYMQEIGKGYDSLRAGNAILSSYKALIEKAKLSSDINIIDLSKIEALSNAFDNMSKAMEENYNKSKTDKAKTVNNFFLSAYNALNYENGQVDIYTFADRIGRTNDYYTDDYTAVKNELQAAVKNAVISNVTSEGMYQDGKGISFETMSYYIDSNPDAMDNISFAPEYISFVKQISYDIISYRYSSALDITASYNNGLKYTVKTPVAIGSAQLDIGAFDADTPENNRVGTLADIIIPEQQYDEASGLFTYKFNFG